MSVRLRETIKKIRRNLSLRTLSKDDRKPDEDDEDRAKVRDANIGGGFWSRHRIGSSGSAAKFSISTDTGLDRLPASWPAVTGSGSLGGSTVRMPAPTSDDEDDYDDGDEKDEMHRSPPSERVEAAASIGSGADRSDSRVSAAADDRLLMLRRRNPQQPEASRTVKLTRADGSAGFGFVAGGQRPMTIRTVDQGGPSEGLLLPGDQIVEVNGVNTESLRQSAVLELIRSDGDHIQLTVRQPPQLACTRSILRINSDEGKKLRKSSSRVRFSEAIQEVDAEEHNQSTMKDETWTNVEPREPTLKIYLENNQTKTVQFDESTTVEDLLRLLLQKLEILAAADHFALVIREPGPSENRHFRAFSHDEPLVEALSTGGQCSLRLLYAPKDPYDLLKNDEVAFDYLYKQCCNDLMDDRLLPDACASQSAAGVALRLASLFMLEHALVQGIPPNKVTAKKIDKEFGLRTFMMPSLAATISPKILHRKLDSFFKLNRGLAAPGQKRVTALQARLHFMQIAAGLPLFCARRFPVRSFERNKLVDMALLVGPNCGVSQAVGCTFQRIVQLEDVHDLKVINPPEEQYSGASLKLVEFRCGDQLEVTRLYMRESLAYDFCTFLNSYRTTLTGNSAANSIYLTQKSGSHVMNTNGNGRLTSNGNAEDVFLPPADYDEAENNTDIDDGDDDVGAVNSALAAAFDDLDDGLLLADASERTVRMDAIPLTAGDFTSGEGAASGNDIPATVSDSKYCRLRLGPAGPNSSLTAHSVSLAGGMFTKHDEEIGIQMSAIDAATSSDGCLRGDDESGIDSDSEDSGNETLNSVDTNSSFALAEAAHRSERLSPSRTLARGRRVTASRELECAPAVSTFTAALPHGRPSAELPPAPGIVGGCGASLTKITFGTVAHGDSIIGADADDVSTEDDEEEENDCGQKEKAATGSVNGSSFFGRITVVAQPTQNGSPIFVGTLREESGRIAAEAPTVTRRRAAVDVAAAASDDHQLQRVRPSDLSLAANIGAEQRLLGKRPASDGFFVGEHWCAQSSAVDGDAVRSPRRLVRQDATERAPALSPVAVLQSVVAVSPPLPDPSQPSKVRGARSATVASSSRLAQAFMKLSASSKASGSYDFCPATPPRLRPISAPYNIRSTAHSVLANAKPVRASLSDPCETWAASESGSQQSSAPVFRVPRPTCPPPAPPPSASGVREGATDRGASLRTPTTCGSSGGGDAGQLPATYRAVAATPPKASETTAIRSGEAARDEVQLRNKLAAATAAATSHTTDGDEQRRQLRRQSDHIVITGGSQKSSPIERRRSVGAQFTVRSSSGLSLRAVADADSVSYKLDSHPKDGGSATSAQAASNSTVSNASPQTKTRVLARILDALKPRKKSASLSRAASAIELATDTGGKGSSLPRWLGTAPKQRPSILSKPRQSSIALLRATSYGDCEHGDAEKEVEEEEEELFGSLGDAWPVGRLRSSLPAAEVCAIDTTGTSSRETWSRSCILETFLPPSPTVTIKQPTRGGSMYTEEDSACTSDAQSQQIASHSHTNMAAACGSAASERPLTCNDEKDCDTPELLAADVAVHTAVAALNQTVAAVPNIVDASQEDRATGALDSSHKSRCSDYVVGPDTKEGNSSGGRVCSDSISGSAVMLPSFGTSAAVAVEPGDMLSSKVATFSEHVEEKEALLDGGSKHFTVERAPAVFGIQCLNAAVDVDASTLVDKEEEESQNQNEFSTVLQLTQSEGSISEDTEAAADQQAGSPTTVNVTVSRASLAAMMGIALTVTLDAIGDQPPNDAAKACVVVDRLLEALKSSGNVPPAGSCSTTFHVDSCEWIQSRSESPEAAAVNATAAIQRLLLEAQRMVGECKQMVAAIARRQRNVASSTSSSSCKDAENLREDERCCVVCSFGTFTRLMEAAVRYAAAAEMGPWPENAGWNQHTNISLLRDRLLLLGKAYATALRAAVFNPSPKSFADVTDMSTANTGTSHASGVAVERPEESRTDIGAHSATAVATSSCGPPVGGSDDAVRRLMTIATELATALGGLIRLLRQGSLLPPNIPTSGADEI